MARKGILSQEEIDALLGIAKISNREADLGKKKSLLKREQSTSFTEPALSTTSLIVSATLVRKTITLEEYLNLQIGDFLPLNLNSTIAVDIANTPIFTAVIERFIDKRALRLIDQLDYEKT
ncbi:FliM/FliN family flagellar motor switch protein [Legionella sp. D16C41]|uniref:FliM/FliN family flagellar motor switch protein n=1 Tax=Legionella sp. D16C41 TaxID=3402688 RepID=UPI003AF5D9E0